MTLPTQRYLRRGAVQRYLGVSEPMMKKLVEAGVLTPVYFVGGGRAFFDRAKLLEAESSGRLFSPSRNLAVAAAQAGNLAVASAKAGTTFSSHTTT